jgi:hypothetical protein
LEGDGLSAVVLAFVCWGACELYMQIFSVAQHFRFLVREGFKKSLMSLLEDENKKKVFTRIKVKARNVTMSTLEVVMSFWS